MNFREYFRTKIPGLYFEEGSWLEKVKEILLMPMDIFNQVLDYIPRLRDLNSGDVPLDGLILDAKMRNMEKYGEIKRTPATAYEPILAARIQDAWNVWAESGSRFGLNRLITMVGYTMDDTIYEYGINEDLSIVENAMWGEEQTYYNHFWWGDSIDSEFCFTIYINDSGNKIFFDDAMVFELIHICKKFAPAHCYLSAIYFTDGMGNIVNTRNGDGSKFGVVPPSQNDGQINYVTDLENKLKAVLGSNLIGLWIGEDIISNADGYAESWPARVGSTLNNVTGNKFNVVLGDESYVPQYSTSELLYNKRKAIQSLDLLPKALRTVDTTPCSEVMILAKQRGEPGGINHPLPNDGYANLYLTTGGLVDAFVLEPTLKNSGATYKVDTYSQGYTELSVLQKLYQIIYTNTLYGVNLGGDASGNLPFLGTISLIIKCTNEVTEDQRNKILSILNIYYFKSSNF